MLAEYHFPSTEASKRNIVRKRGPNKNVWTVGEPGLGSFNREKLMDREELASELKLNINRKWALMTYYVETKESVEYNINSVKHEIS